MSLLQEMETHGLADCEFNRRLWKNDRRIKRLLNIYLPVFNDHQEIERDEQEAEASLADFNRDRLIRITKEKEEKKEYQKQEKKDEKFEAALQRSLERKQKKSNAIV